MNISFSNNSDLVFQLKKGNAGAYAYLVDTYNHKLRLYAKSLMKGISISDDIVQNVFIKVWERRDHLKSGFSIKSYLYKSVYNACINEYKKNQAVTALEKEYIEELNRIVEDKDGASLDRLIGLVKEAIQKLPPKCKEIFLLSKKEGLTNMEISEYLSISKNTIERQINIAFSKIRDNVGGMP